MIPIGVTGAEDFVIWNKRKMKLNQTLMAEIACALDMRKKNGDPVWDDDTEAVSYTHLTLPTTTPV